MWILRHRDTGTAPKHGQVGNVCPEDRKTQLSNSSDTLQEFHHWKHFFGISILFIRHLFTNTLPKESKVTAGKSTESDIVDTREVTEVRIKNGEVRLQALGACGRKWRLYLGTPVWGCGCWDSMMGGGRTPCATTTHICSKVALSWRIRPNNYSESLKIGTQDRGTEWWKTQGEADTGRESSTSICVPISHIHKRA